MSEFSVRRSKINHIFISHLHGDHIFGLPGYLNSLSLNGRTAELTIVGPVGIKAYVETIIHITQGHRSFPIVFNELSVEEYQQVIVLPSIEVYAFPLKHRVPTFGYLFRERPTQCKIDPEAIPLYSLTIPEIKSAKAGDDIVRANGTIIPNADLVLSPTPLRSFAYCSDTIYDPDIVPYIKGATMIYHEATYLHELADKARSRMHATTKEAALIAKQGRVNKLLIGHYSSRYKDLQPLLEETRETFNNAHLAEEGKFYSIE